jgi:hypothetical protein
MTAGGGGRDPVRDGSHEACIEAHLSDLGSGAKCWLSQVT